MVCQARKGLILRLSFKHSVTNVCGRKICSFICVDFFSYLSAAIICFSEAHAKIGCDANNVLIAFYENKVSVRKDNAKNKHVAQARHSTIAFLSQAVKIFSRKRLTCHAS